MAAVNGTANNDSLNGTTSNDTLNGLAGNDILIGNAGNDTLNGGTGQDIMNGGLGNDVFVVDDAGDIVNENVGEGTDLVQASLSYTLTANVENLTLTGTGAISGTGNGLNNTILGNSGVNTLDGGSGDDTLNGMLGADVMIGGMGNDFFIVDNAGDVVSEGVNAGTDKVQSSVTFSLASAADIENLTLSGTALINGTGNTGNNTILGNTAKNTIDGGNGDDYLDGGAGIDRLVGGLGDDTFVVDVATDVVVEASGEGNDTVRSSVTITLAANVENLVLTGTGSLNGTGNAVNNSIVGGAGANILDGGAGADTLEGGLGSDTYVIDNAGDIATEALNAGTDLVKSSVTYTLGANLENLTLTGSSNIDAIGNALKNLLTGNAGDNSLDGGAGVDTMIGGAGSDIFIVDSVGELVSEVAGVGTDTVISAVTYTLGTNLENLTLSGVSNTNAIGNTVANVLTGNAGNNTLSGLAGADTMIGAAGNDTYIVDNVGDVVSENSGEGTDTVMSAVTFTLGADVENLTITGTTAASGTGNGLDNTIIGGSGVNILTGAGGNDVLNGMGGIDTMIGGTGNDTYTVDNAADVVSENASEGTDTVVTTMSYTLSANIENLTLNGTAAVGTGNADVNVITGNSAANTLNGMAGADTLIGGTGNDVYVVDAAGDVVSEDASAGTDTVQSAIDYSLASAANVENLTLTGTLDINATGNAGVNVLLGNAGANSLDGGAGADTMTGGAGDDTYLVDAAGDVIVEASGGGADTVRTSASYVLGANVENLTLTGVAAINGTGSAVDNVITGNSAANSLNGLAGADTMIGGAGDDTYFVDAAGDIVSEIAGEGSDSVQSAVSYTLGAEVENLTLTGTTSLNGTGNSVANVLTGNTGANTLDGGAGADTMIGGAGNDTYVVDVAGDIVSEAAAAGTDTVLTDISFSIAALTNVENITLTGSGNVTATGNTVANILIGNSGDNSLDGGAGTDTMTGGLGDDTYFVDSTTDIVNEATMGGSDTVNASVTFTLGAFVDNLTLTGAGAINGTGNADVNVLTGNAAANTLNGMTGADTMVGGDGNDAYVVDNAADVISEVASQGTDSVTASVSYTLSAEVENLTLGGTANI
ncbi:MAG TPA: calcium-binding protein, partial [Patescibacteria group bacterium]|nr:calcium-binding protein [Patescibacteria group bacterium]